MVSYGVNYNIQWKLWSQKFSAIFSLVLTEFYYFSSTKNVTSDSHSQNTSLFPQVFVSVDPETVELPENVKPFY